MNRFLFNFLSLILAINGANCSAQNEIPKHADDVTIYVDNWGIPHIYGKTDADAIFGWAYFRAQDRLTYIEKQTVRAIGRSSELEGIEAIYPEAGGIGYDLILHAFDYIEKAKYVYKTLEPKYKALCDAYTDGLNYYISKHPEHKMLLLEKFEPWMVIASEASHLAGWGGTNDAGLKQLPITRASNSLAIGPSHTSNGSTLLLANPHQYFDNNVIEFHLISDEGLNIYGNGTGGLGVFPIIGFNGYMGWTVTINAAPDLGDLYLMNFNHPTDSLSYEFDEAYRKVDIKSVNFKVKKGDELVDKTIDIWNSVYGPIFQLEDGNRYSFSIESGRTFSSLQQTYEMSKAKNLNQFKEAIAMLGWPMHNITYVDHQNIYYICNAYVPKRDTTYNWSAPVPGNTSKTLWKGFHTMEDLPSVENPKDGFVLNANSSPFTTTFESNPDIGDYPKYMYSGRTLGNPLKDNSRTARMKIALQKDSVYSFEWLEELVTDNTNTVFLELALPDIKSRWESLKKENPKRAERLKEPIETLLNWNGKSDKTSVEATLYYVTNSFLYDHWNSETRFADALEETLERLNTEFGQWQVPWENIMRHQRLQSDNFSWDSTKMSYGTNGADRGQGVMLGVFPEPNPFNMESKTLKRRATSGNSYVSVLEFTKEGPKARNIVTYGNSADPSSHHYMDQAEMFANGELRDVYFSMEDISSNLKMKYKPGQEIK